MRWRAILQIPPMKRGWKKGTARGSTSFRYLNVNWEDSFAKIARELGVTRQAVQTYAKRQCKGRYCKKDA